MVQKSDLFSTAVNGDTQRYPKGFWSRSPDMIQQRFQFRQQIVSGEQSMDSN